MTITSQPKFLGLIGYHISLAMELRWRALPAGSAITANVALPCSFGLLDLNSIQCNSHFGRYKKEIKKERKNQRKKEKTIIFEVSNL